MKKLILTMGLILSVYAKAHPVIFKGGTVISTESSEMLSDYQVAYTYHPQNALGLHFLKEGTHEFQFLQHATLFKRWLNDESQGNIYGIIAAGAERFSGAWTSANMVELMTDWEDRDYYVLASQKWISRNGNKIETAKDDLWHSRFRAGLAPFRSESHELGIWYIVQFDKHNSDSWTTTQLFRFYFKNVLWEIGAGLNGSYQINLMTHL